MSQNTSFQEKLYSMTTLINAEYTYGSDIYELSASGFFYAETKPSTDENEKGMVILDKWWLITNKHVLFPEENKIPCLVNYLIFHLRRKVNDTIEWIPIKILQSELLRYAKIHTKDNVDVAAINISSYIKDIMRIKDDNIILPFHLSEYNLPDHQPLKIEVSDDILVASYPKGFYDYSNKFPIVKSGIIASAWGKNFWGDELFEIDAQLFPGSSGGLVISKPKDIAIIDGKLKYSSSKQFIFLGVYSGEYIWKDTMKIDQNDYSVDKSYGLGNVWYSYLVPEIIKSGKKISIPFDGYRKNR